MTVTVAVGEKKYKLTNSVANVENGNSAQGNCHQSRCPRDRKRKTPLAYRFKPLLSAGRKRRQASKNGESFLRNLTRSLRPERGVHYLDKYSRFVFPVSYISFLVIYFYVYLYWGISQLQMCYFAIRRTLSMLFSSNYRFIARILSKVGKCLFPRTYLHFLGNLAAKLNCKRMDSSMRITHWCNKHIIRKAYGIHLCTYASWKGCY